MYYLDCLFRRTNVIPTKYVRVYDLAMAAFLVDSLDDRVEDLRNTFENTNKVIVITKMKIR